MRRTSIKVNASQEGERLETKVQRLINSGEPVSTDAAPLIYTERKDGVVPLYDITSDKWVYVLEAMQAKHEKYVQGRGIKPDTGDGGTEPKHGTDAEAS